MVTVVFPEREGGSADEIATALEAAQAAQAGAEAAQAATEGLGAIAVAAVDAQEALSIAAVVAQQATSVAAVVTQQGTSTTAVAAQGTTSIAAVAAQQTTSVNAVSAQQTTSVNAVAAQGVTSIGLVEDEGDTQIAAVTAAAADMIDAAASAQYENLAKARLETEISTGARVFTSIPETLPADWVLTNVTRNADGSYTGLTNGTMVATLTSANYIIPGDRFCYVTRADSVTGEDTITIGVTSPTGSTTMATAASTTEPLPGAYRQTWSNTLSRPSTVITITIATAGTVWEPEVRLTDSAYYPEIRRSDEVVPVPQLPIRTDMFEWWKRPGSLTYVGDRALEKLIDFAVDGNLGVDAAVTFTGSISGTTLTVASGLSGVVKIGQVVSGGATAADTTIMQQLSGTTGSTGTYRVSVSQTVASTSLSAASGKLYAPYATASALPAFDTGSVFGFHRGTSLRESLTQFRVTSYGTLGNTVVGYTQGASLEPFPRLSAFDEIATGDWTDNGDTTFSVTKSVSGPITLQDDGYEEIVVFEIDMALEAEGLYYAARKIMEDVSGGTFTASISGTTMTVTGTPTFVLDIGQEFTGSGVTAGTEITALGTGSGANGTYTVNNSQTVSSTTMTVTTTEAVKNRAGNKASSISGTDATIQIRPTGDGVIGTDYRYEFIRRWSPMDAGDYARDAYLFGLELEGSNHGYGPLAGPDRTVADRIILTGCRTHLAVIAGGSISNFLAYADRVNSNAIVFYRDDATSLNWQAKRGFVIGASAALYSHNGSPSGTNLYERGEIEDVQLRYGREPSGRAAGGLRGSSGGAAATMVTKELRKYAVGFQDTGQMGTVSTYVIDSEMRDCLFREHGRFRPRLLTEDCIACVENISNPLVVGERSMRMLEVADSQVVNNCTVIATNTSNALGDYTPTVIATLNAITTPPVLRRNLIIVSPQLVVASTGATTITTLPAGGVPLFDSDDNVWVFLAGSRMTVSQTSGSTTHTWAEYLSRTGQDAGSIMFDARAFTLDDLLEDFTNGNLTFRQTRLAANVQAACRELNAGCRWTVDRWPDEPTVDECARILWAL